MIGPFAVSPGMLPLISSGRFTAMFGPPRDARPVVSRVGRVAVMRLDGVLTKAGEAGTSTVDTRRAVRAMASSADVGSLLLVFDSPGGTVSGTADLGADIAAAAKKKPVWAFVEDQAAGAAYWLASQATKIYANNSTAIVGGVGVANVVYDLSAAAEKQGVRAMVFGTGPLKGAGTPGAPVTEGQGVYFQSLADGPGREFAAAVVSGRRMSGLSAEVMKGGVFGATDAQRLGLIDGVHSFDEVLAGLGRQATPTVPTTATRAAARFDPMAAYAGWLTTLGILQSRSHFSQVRPAASYLGTHEAGHAVAAVLAALPVDYVEVTTTGGVMLFAGTWATGDAAGITARTVATAAGSVAELIGGYAGLGVTFTAGASDMKVLSNFALVLAHECPGRTMDDPFTAAEQLLRANWSAVVAVAQQLDRVGRLSGEQVKTIVQGAK